MTIFESRVSNTHIAIVMPNLGGGGAEFVAQQWASWLNQNGYKVTIVLTHSEGSEQLDDGISVERLHGHGPRAHLMELIRLVRRERYDVLIGLMPYFNLLVILAASRFGRRLRPRVLISGRNMELPLRQTHGPKFKLMLAMAKRLYKRSDGFIAISHSVAAEAAGLYGIEMQRMFVVPNPATAKVGIRSVDSRTKSVQVDHSAGREALNIVVPARLVLQKRPLLAISVAEEIKRVVPGVEVHFFGDGPERAAIEQTARIAGVPITLHGWVSDWFDHCPSNSVVLLTSLAEGFGNVLVEATAVGIPTVASSRCLGSSDAIVPGITGAICAGDSSAEYAQAVLRAHGMPPVRATGWLERFTPENSGLELEKAIQSLGL
jgi:glycosyltransferase involved in cell wall biosynthesis